MQDMQLCAFYNMEKSGLVELTEMEFVDSDLKK
jgi:hypothetical protein